MNAVDLKVEKQLVMSSIPVGEKTQGKAFAYPRNKVRFLWPDRGERWCLVGDGFRDTKSR